MGQQSKRLCDVLLIGGAVDVGQCVKAFWHRRERKKVCATVKMERTTSDEVSCEDKPVCALIPDSERKISHQTRATIIVPSFKGGQQKRRVAHRARRGESLT